MVALILKKPYAFLIRRFRIIHFILAVLIMYLSVRTYTIYSFFSRYTSNVYSTLNSNVSTNYVTLFMFLVSVIIVAFSLAMYILMTKKNKPKVLYIAMTTYYIVYFIMLLSLFSLFRDFASITLAIKTAMLFRDLVLLSLVPQLVFFILALVRSSGFDIKKFNFSKDLEELDIEEKDSEEFEFVLGLDSYKYFRTLRKKSREIKYYFLENKFVITSIVGIFVLILLTGIILNATVYHKVYKTGEKFQAGGLTMTINDAYLTNRDYKDEVINKDMYFLVVSTTISNNSGSSTVLDMTNFKLNVNKKIIYPVLSRNKYFIDLGRGYSKEKILDNSTKTYIIVFELNKEQIKNKYKLSILDSIDYKSGTINTKLKNVKLVPIVHTDSKLVGSYSLDETIDFSDTLLKKSQLTIKDYEFSRVYNYTYEKCVMNNCQETTDTVKASVGKTLLIIDSELELDESSTFVMANNNNTFYETFMKTSVGDKLYYIDDLTPNSVTDKTILEVKDNAYDASDLSLYISVRGKIYTIELAKE